MPQPNGYRKALRFMRHAEKFGFPIITFVDTPGAYAGKNAEDLGQVRCLSAPRWAEVAIKWPRVSCNAAGRHQHLLCRTCDVMAVCASRCLHAAVKALHAQLLPPRCPYGAAQSNFSASAGCLTCACVPLPCNIIWSLQAQRRQKQADASLHTAMQLIARPATGSRAHPQQGDVVALHLQELCGLRVPIISVLLAIGECGSGPALALSCWHARLHSAECSAPIN